jgi:beta-mannanase
LRETSAEKVAEQFLAVETENFEAAMVLERDFEEIGAEIAEIRAKIAESGAEFAENAEKAREKTAHSGVFALNSATIRSLEALSQSHSHKMAEFRATATAKAERHSAKLKSEEFRLKTSENDLENDFLNAEKEENDTKLLINAEISDLLDRKNAAEAKNSELEAEIEDLKRILREKEAQKTEQERIVKKTAAQIAGIQNKFVFF